MYRLRIKPEMFHNFKFRVGEQIEHEKTQGRYVITGTPDTFRLEATNEPAYAYKSASDGIQWVRSQSEMEAEGRFKRITQRPSDYLPTINGMPVVELDPTPWSPATEEPDDLTRNTP